MFATFLPTITHLDSTSKSKQQIIQTEKFEKEMHIYKRKQIVKKNLYYYYCNLHGSEEEKQRSGIPYFRNTESKTTHQ